MTSRCDWFGRRICRRGLGRVLDCGLSLGSGGGIVANCLVVTRAWLLDHGYRPNRIFDAASLSIFHPAFSRGAISRLADAGSGCGPCAAEPFLETHAAEARFGQRHQRALLRSGRRSIGPRKNILKSALNCYSNRLELAWAGV